MRYHTNKCASYFTPVGKKVKNLVCNTRFNARIGVEALAGWSRGFSRTAIKLR